MIYQNNLVPVFHPSCLIPTGLINPGHPYRDWNSYWKEYNEYSESMAMISRQADLIQRRVAISGMLPSELVFRGERKLEYNNGLDCYFTNVSRYMVNETGIGEESAQLLMCAHILASACGRCIIDNGEHLEAPVINSIAFAISGQRKSTVNNRLCSPVISFSESLQKTHSRNRGNLFKQVIKSLPRVMYRPAP